MTTFLALTIAGLVAGSVYALTAAGLVVTYTTSGIFNFAHGAIGMMAAFMYWELAVHHHWPMPLAAAVVLFVFAPLMGAVIERVLMRRLRGAPIVVTLTVTLGLLLFLIGLATLIWNPTVARTVRPFFAGHRVSLHVIVVTWHQLTVVFVALAVAVALRVFLFGTRAGTATRAVVDDPDLAAMTGANPFRFGQLGWALGAMLAALAGILLAPLVTLDIQNLTFLVINGYAAAMFGRLRNLPMTFVGGLGLGLAEAYAIGYLPLGSFISQIRPVVPMIFLFAVLVVLPHESIRGRALTLKAPRIAGLRESLLAGAVFLAIAWVVSGHLSDINLSTASHGVAVALIMLSLVLLAGYGGQVSLCQLTFVGLGAFAMSKVSGGGSILGVVAAMAFCAVIGAAVALPALRLRGLYLALLTLAFGQTMDIAFFQNSSVMGSSGALRVGRIDLGFIPTQSRRAYFMLLCVTFVIVGASLLAVRRSSFGRRLMAMGDSPAACVTLGMSITRTKLAVFALSAALAGLGGALYGGQQGQVDASDFTVLASLVLLLLCVVWGIRTVSGVLLAGLVFAIFPVIQTHVPALRDLAYLGTGLAAIGIGRNPNGVFGGDTPAARRRDKKAARARASARLVPTVTERVVPAPTPAQSRP